MYNYFYIFLFHRQPKKTDNLPARGRVYRLFPNSAVTGRDADGKVSAEEKRSGFFCWGSFSARFMFDVVWSGKDPHFDSSPGNVSSSSLHTELKHDKHMLDRTWKNYCLSFQIH